MLVKCDQCGTLFFEFSSKIKSANFCGPLCERLTNESPWKIFDHHKGCYPTVHISWHNGRLPWTKTMKSACGKAVKYARYTVSIEDLKGTPWYVCQECVKIIKKELIREKIIKDIIKTIKVSEEEANSIYWRVSNIKHLKRGVEQCRI